METDEYCRPASLADLKALIEAELADRKWPRLTTTPASSPDECPGYQHSRPLSDYIRAGQKTSRIAGDEALPPWLVYGSDESYERNGVRVIVWRDVGNQRTGGDN